MEASRSCEGDAMRGFGQNRNVICELTKSIDKISYDEIQCRSGMLLQHPTDGLQHHAALSLIETGRRTTSGRHVGLGLSYRLTYG
jgi:hypothetical protein